MSDRPAQIVERETRELVRRRGVDPGLEGAQPVADLVDEVIADYVSRSDVGDLPLIDDQADLRKSVVDRIAGFGPLQPLLDDPEVEEIWINGPGRVFCARDGRHRLTNVLLTRRRDPADRGTHVAGERSQAGPVNAVRRRDPGRWFQTPRRDPDITRRHWAVNIRKFVVRANDLDELVELGSFDSRAAEFLRAAVVAGLNIVVSGGTQTGKTTLLNCLASSIPAGQRIVTCEEVFELRISLPDVVSMQTRQANLEGLGAIDLRRLVVEALRMRPDRIIVGEVRQQEALDLLVALNSGLPGMTSIHANSALEAVVKLTTLPLLAGENVTHSFVVPTVAASIDLIVHLTADRGTRRTSQILGVTGRVESGQIETVSLFTRTSERFEWTGHRPPKTESFVSAGIDLEGILQ